MVILTPFLSGASAQTFSDKQRGDIDSLIRKYILTHPEVIADSMEQWQKRRETDRDQQQRKTLS